MSRLARGALLLALLAGAGIVWVRLTVEPIMPGPFEVHGQRLFEGDVPRFDRARLPIIIVPGAERPALEASIVSGDDCTLALRPYPIDGGWRFEGRSVACAPTPGAARLAMRIDGGHVTEHPILWAKSPEDLPGIDRIATARSGGDVGAARAALAALTEPDPEQALWLPVERARVAHMTGDLNGARAAWLAGARVAASRGMRGERARRLNAAAYVALNQRRFGEMDRLTTDALAALETHDDATHRANVLHMRGVLALETGDWRAAAARFEAAHALAKRLGLRRVRRLVVESQALSLGALGRHGAALALLDGLESLMADASPRDRSRLRVNQGWLWLGAGDAGRARTAFEAALRDAEQPTRRANIRLNLAHAALADHRADDARRHLEAAIADGAAKTHGLSVDMLRARLALKDDPATAAALFAAVETRARHELGPTGGDAAWRALHGQGRALRQRDPARAAMLFERALTDMARQGARTGLLGPRGAYFAARRALVADAIELALERGAAAEAFGIADRDRARVLRAARTRMRVQRLAGEARARWLDRAGDLAAARDRLAELRGRADLVAGEARDRWMSDVRAAEEARRAAFESALALLDRAAPVDPGPDGADGDAVSARLEPDAWLVATVREADDEAGRARWRSFRVDHRGIEHQPITDDPLGPWRAVLAGPDGPSHIYLVTGGHPRGFAAATESHGDQPPLLVTHTVAWLPFAGLLLRPTHAPGGPPLVVADPGLDLPHARAAGRALAERLADARLLVGQSATAEAITAQLSTTRLFHFSGHGVLREAQPWDAHLRLARGRRFDVVDILGQRLEGARVVLNGCETGPEALLSRDDVLGLPEAFLAAGARSVIATDRPVPDDAARDFTEAFYAAGGLTDPADALRAVARRQRRAGRATWSAWRLLGVR